MAKLLTPINIGPLTLSHRVCLLGPPTPWWSLPASDVARLAAPGGLVIQSFSLQPGELEISTEAGTPCAGEWRRLTDAVRAQGGVTIAQIACCAAAKSADENEVDALLARCRDLATLAREAAFDGAELDAAGSVPPEPATPLLENVQALIDVWGADRIGVQLAPFAWMSGPEDERAAGPFGRLLSALSEMEVAYVHLAGTVTPGCGDLSTSPLGRRLRAAFPGMLIASGAFTPASAIAAVESRWADAIGFSLIAGDGISLLAAISDAAGQR